MESSGDTPEKVPRWLEIARGRDALPVVGDEQLHVCQQRRCVVAEVRIWVRRIELRVWPELGLGDWRGGEELDGEHREDGLQDDDDDREREDDGREAKAEREVGLEERQQPEEAEREKQLRHEGPLKRRVV
eukprot:6183727-Pleurochrysis_carterae.AAC.2